MTCGDCGSMLPTNQTVRASDVDIRFHTCACGSRWQSEQRIVRRLLSVGTRPVPHKGGPNRVHPSTGAPPAPDRAEPGTPADGRGVGGALPSDPSSSGSNPAPSEPPDQTPARVNGRRPRRGTRLVYPDAFLREWNQTTKAGSKERACDWWEANGQPEFGAAWRRWEASAEWRQSWYTPPHVVSWLGDGRWQQDPGETRAKAPPPPDVRCAFHRAPGTRGRRPPAGWADACPECKHARAAAATREGAATSASEITESLLARSRPRDPPPSREQLHEARVAMKGGGT